MIKPIFFLSALFLANISFSQSTYNTIVHEGLAQQSELVSEDVIALLQDNAEEILIYNEVNNIPCEEAIVFVYVVDENDKPAKSFRFSVLEFEGDFTYNSIHKNEPFTIWVDNTGYGEITYDLVAHKKAKISELEKEKAIRVDITHKECAFIFKKMVLSK